MLVKKSEVKKVTVFTDFRDVSRGYIVRPAGSTHLNVVGEFSTLSGMRRALKAANRTGFAYAVYSERLTTPRYAVVVSVAKMPNNCWGIYKHVGIVKYWESRKPSTLAATRTQEVVWYRGRLHAEGKDTAFNRALAEAEKKMIELGVR